MSQESERRQYKRVKDEFSVKIVKELSKSTSQELNIDIAKAINVSANGILVSIKEPIEIGAIVTVSFLKPNSFDFFESSGKVVRIEDNEDSTYALAINFLNLTPDDSKKLNYYLMLCEA